MIGIRLRIPMQTLMMGISKTGNTAQQSPAELFCRAFSFLATRLCSALRIGAPTRISIPTYLGARLKILFCRAFLHLNSSPEVEDFKWVSYNIKMKRILFLLLLLQFVVSCAPLAEEQRPDNLLGYIPQADEQTQLLQHAPIFIIEESDKPYNRIGTPTARMERQDEEVIFVDPRSAVIYAEQRKFSTSRDTYTNLIYRIHFSRTPFALFPFQITAGENVGLFVVVTLNSSNFPVLYTTVHTCGCYLAFIPTSRLPADAFPPRWPNGQQVVYGQTLPSLLEFPDNDRQSPPVSILIKHASHRVEDVWLPEKSFVQALRTDQAPLDDLQSLANLPVEGTQSTTSFFVPDGTREGYVKGSHKPLERILMSWWAFDWHIGEDKRLGKNSSEPPVFFTSLKLWARDESDMRDFPRFLRYWGWDL